MGLAFFIASLVFLADFAIKTYLRLNFPAASIPVIKNIFQITVVFNTGAAFGILREKTAFLIYASLIFILFFFFIIGKEDKRSLAFLIPFGLILGGALSNLYDRIFLGFVVDYLDIQFRGKTIWPVFNLSDTAITIGVILLLWQSYKGKAAKG